MPLARTSATTPPVRAAAWPIRLTAVTLSAGALAVYRETFRVPLLFDDRAAIVDNPTIRHWATAFLPPPGSTVSGRPVLNLSLALNHALSSTDPWSYHLLNLVIHVLAGLTLFGIVRRTLARRALPAATAVAGSVALLWTLHPLQTESVTYVIQRAESLMGLFYLLTLYGFIRSLDSCRAGLWRTLSVGACLLGVATKEVTVTAPLLVFLYDRTFVAGSFREAWRRRRWLHLGLAATWLPLTGLVAGAGWNRHGMAGFNVGIAPGTYWLTQFEAITRYLGLSLWPHPLVFEYSAVRSPRALEIGLEILLVTGLAGAVLVALWRRPALGFLGAWFFVILGPTSLMPGRFQFIVEHRMYLPLAAVMMLLVLTLTAVARRRGWLICGALALAFGVVAAGRNKDYGSELTLWRDTVAKRPGNAVAQYNLGNAWLEASGHLPDAIASFQAALRIKPDYADAHNSLGFAWARLSGHLADARAEFELAARLDPANASAHANLGNACLEAPGGLDEAVMHYETALRLNPDYAEAHYGLGLAWMQIPGRLTDAITHFEAALRLRPDFAPGWHTLGLAWIRAGNLPAAAGAFQAELRLAPADPAAQRALAAVLQQARARP